MARAPDERIEEAYKLYKKGMKLIDIANKLSVPDGTVRRWKSTHNWEGERLEKKNKKSERSETKKVKIEPDVQEVMENTNLTEKQKLFCLYYVKSFNATKAYFKAYGCSYETAMVEGCNSLKNPKIKAQIMRLKQNKLNREFLSEEDIFQKYMDIAFADITDFLTFGQEEVPVMAMYGPLVIKDEETGEKINVTKVINVVKFKESDQIDGTLISEVKQGRDGASIKLHDRMKALEWLAAHMNMATDEQKARIAVLRKQAEGNNIDDSETGVVMLAPVLEDTDVGIIEGGEENE